MTFHNIQLDTTKRYHIKTYFPMQTSFLSLDKVHADALVR